MSVKTASKFVSRVMRAAIKDTIFPANQGTSEASKRPALSEAGNVSRQFGQELEKRLDVYTGSVDEFGSPSNTVDSWRLQFSGRAGNFKAANGAATNQKRPA